MKNEDQINSLHKGHNELVDLVKRFPAQERASILFDQWSLQDVLAHFSAWSKLDADNIEFLRDGKDLIWVSDEDAFNAEEVRKRKGFTWEELFQEFDQSGKHLIEVFQSLPEEIWNRLCGPESKHSPRTFIKAHIWHYHEAHIPSVKEALEKIS